jgi:hypothetical protein
MDLKKIASGDGGCAEMAQDGTIRFRNEFTELVLPGKWRHVCGVLSCAGRGLKMGRSPV